MIIAVSIPLSIICSILAFKMLGETINLMTLGGRALAIGILVYDATVTIENMERHLHMGKIERLSGALDSTTRTLPIEINLNWHA